MNVKLAQNLSKTRNSIATARAQKSDLVVIPAYTETGEFGYFVAHETKDGDYFHYRAIDYANNYSDALMLFMGYTANKA